MSLLGLILACARPAPPAVVPPPAQPPPVAARLDGWSLVRADHLANVWTEVWDDRAAEIAQEAIDRGVAAQRGPNDRPTDLDDETARRFLAAYQFSPRPAVWSWTETRTEDHEFVEVYHPVPAPMTRHAVELLGVGPALRGTDTLGLRVWFRSLDDEPPTLAVTDWTDASEPVEGATLRSYRAMPVTCGDLGIDPVAWSDPARTPCADCRTACSELPLGEDRLVGTEHVWRDAEGRIAGSCAAVALRRAEGGTAYFTPTCFDEDPDACPHCLEHLQEGMWSDVTGPHLPRAWFGRGDQRWLVVNRSDLPVARACLAHIPDPDQPVQPTACVGDRSDLGGF